MANLNRTPINVSKRVRLNKKTIDGFRPRTVRYDMYDADLPGFHIRLHPSGLKTFRMKYVVLGKQRVVQIGEHGHPWTAEEARKEGERLRGLICAGVDPIAQREQAKHQQLEASRRAITVSTLAKRWLEEGRDAAPTKRERSWATDASCLRHHILPLIGDILVRDLTKGDVERAQRRIAARDTASDRKTGKKRGRSIVRGGPGISRRSMAALSACLSWAVDQEIVESNVVSRVKKLPQGKKNRFLSNAEARRLLETVALMRGQLRLADNFADIIPLLLFTGARRNEIVELEWSEVDLDRSHIILPKHRSKTGEKVISLSQHASSILASRPRSSRYVFASCKDPSRPVVGISRAWQRVRGEANLPDVRLHDLRHSFASFAAAQGASLLMIGKALGHSQPSTTARYAHLTHDPIRELSDGVANQIAGPVLRLAS